MLHPAVARLRTRARSLSTGPVGTPTVREAGPATPTARQKVASLMEVAARILLAPLLIILSLLVASDRVVWEEPAGYRSPGWKRWLAKRSAQGKSMRLTAASHLSSALRRAAAVEESVEADARLVLRRFAESARDSAMLTVQGILYYTTLHVLSFFGVEKAIFAFRSDLERAVCAAAGTWHVTASGARHHYSLLSSMDADYSTPDYVANEDFPAVDGGADATLNAHFASLACKAVYEKREIVEDLVSRHWRMALVGAGAVPAHWTDDHWVPDLVWFVAESERGVILALKGADPLWQVNLKADPPVSKRPRDGVTGEVHCGLWRGLHQRAPRAPPGTTVADTILSALAATDASKPIYITGHSLGGGLAALTAAIVAGRAPSLDARVRAVFTFAAPRFGDDEFVNSFNETFKGRAFRYVHASDMVCKLPPGWGYRHHAAERLITSFPLRGNAASASGRILKEEDDPGRVAFWTRLEDRAAWLFSAVKLARAAVRRDEPGVRTALRAALLAVPGFSDHFLCDYESALRQELMAQKAAARRSAATAAARVPAGAAPPAPLPAPPVAASPFATVQVVSRAATKEGTAAAAPAVIPAARLAAAAPKRAR